MVGLNGVLLLARRWFGSPPVEDAVVGLLELLELLPQAAASNRTEATTRTDDRIRLCTMYLLGG
jgi:hypothetical protein